VLSVLEEGENDDIAKVNVEAILTRFQNLRKQRLKPQVLGTYKRRFRKAVNASVHRGRWRPYGACAHGSVLGGKRPWFVGFHPPGLSKYSRSEL
jgi:hypothetical protein